MKMNMMFGIHTASIGGKLPLMAKVAEMVWNMIYAKLSNSPAPNAIPIPFFRFLAESDRPMAVRMNAANEEAPRCQYSTSNACMLANPQYY